MPSLGILKSTVKWSPVSVLSFAQNLKKISQGQKKPTVQIQHLFISHYFIYTRMPCCRISKVNWDITNIAFIPQLKLNHLGPQ